MGAAGAASSVRKLDEYDVYGDLGEVFDRIVKLTEGMQGHRAQLLHGLAERAANRIKHPVHGAGMSPVDYANVLAEAISDSKISELLDTHLKTERRKIQGLLEQIS